jgi:alkanesulfonate monooxygenase SsuD/methylene tetrahydromethanopterin reductase-like flavin-dependent oxidoreductase (luciferase family)
VATAQALSGGRAILGIGAGWNREEYLAYGWPFPVASVRIAQLAEAIALIRAMWAGAPATFHGQHYTLADTYCEPRPDPIPPVMVGGSGEKYLLRVVAQHADWWNWTYKGREAYARKREALQRHCREVGRDYDTIQHVIRVGILIGETDADIARVKARPDTRSLDDIQVVGTPDLVTETLLDVVRQGAHQLTVNFADVPRADGTRLFAERVLPHLPGR